MKVKSESCVKSYFAVRVDSNNPPVLLTYEAAIPGSTKEVMGWMERIMGKFSVDRYGALR